MSKQDGSISRGTDSRADNGSQRLPIEVGSETFIRVFLGRLVAIVLASLGALVLFSIAWILADYSQIIALIYLTVLAILVTLLLSSAFRKTPAPIDRRLKRLLDILVSTLGLLLTAPLIILVGIAILIDDKGPIFLVQKRISIGGKDISVLKFRTMQRDPDDPRVTRAGRYLRRTSIDELPILINVLRGDMSLVGPYPLSPQEIEEYSKEAFSAYKTVHPGITGLWQISNAPHSDYRERSKQDKHYVDNWSLYLDAKILVKTIPAALRAPGAY
ncbi:MAG: sugar transferase [Anaerolineales bacterium]